MVTKQMMKDETINQLQAYLHEYPEEVASLDVLIKQANEGTELFSRKTVPGHVTGSAIVMKKSDPNVVLMMFHQKLQRWLQPGGHVDPGEYPHEAAIRELKEETNMDGQLHSFHKGKLFPIDIDIHPIPGNINKEEPEHDHYDFRYVLTIDDDLIGENAEQNEVAWVPVEEITEKGLLRIMEKVRRNKEQSD